MILVAVLLAPLLVLNALVLDALTPIAARQWRAALRMRHARPRITATKAVCQTLGPDLTVVFVGALIAHAGSVDPGRPRSAGRAYGVTAQIVAK
mgnify:CR=1 FL=1